MLRSQSVTFRYKNGPTFTFPDIQCEEGASMLILGESGKGKTTLLHLLAGLLQPTSGSITVGDTDITRLSRQELDRFRGKNIGIIFQQSHFVSTLNVQDNLRLAQYFPGVKQDINTIQTILSRLNLGNKIKQKPYKLSQGEQQRVAIARAMLNHPRLILADEPTSALDDKNSNEVINLLQEQAHEAGASLLIVTHDTRLKERFEHRIDLGIG